MTLAVHLEIYFGSKEEQLRVFLMIKIGVFHLRL